MAGGRPRRLSACAPCRPTPRQSSVRPSGRDSPGSLATPTATPRRRSTTQPRRHHSTGTALTGPRPPDGRLRAPLGHGALARPAMAAHSALLLRASPVPRFNRPLRPPAPSAPPGILAARHEPSPAGRWRARGCALRAPSHAETLRDPRHPTPPPVECGQGRGTGPHVSGPLCLRLPFFGGPPCCRPPPRV